MLNLRIEASAEEVRSAMHAQTLPIDVAEIAREEGIVLAPSADFGAEFHGRIEFRPEKRKFILFYPTEPDGSLTPRHRFNVAHELGHYYIEEHRAALLQGNSHNSTPGFVCKEDFERDADEFAAALMIPGRHMESKLSRRAFMDLGGVLNLAKECQTSYQCAAIRYARFTGEACCVLLSANGKVVYATPSDEAKACGFGFVKAIPETAAVWEALDAPKAIKSKASSASAWFGEKRTDPRAFEESWGLGYGQLVLTLLSLEVEDS